ncbi:MAG: hypothetical protein ABJ308_16850 [Halieaceae bacterium]
MNLDAVMQRLPVNLDWVGLLRGEWRGNPRLRRGLLAIWGLLLLYFVLLLSDTAAESRQELATAQQRLQRLLAIDAQQYWLQRATDSQQALEQIRASFPEVSSSGRAEAELRSMMEQVIAEVGHRKLRLTMLPAESVNDGDLWRVVGSVNGVADGDTVGDFVSALETRENYARFRRLKLVRGLTAKKVRIDVEVEAFFRVAGS